MKEHVLRNDSTETSAPHRNARIGSLTYPRNFSADVLPFSVTVRPYHEHLRTRGFSLEIVCNRLRVILDLALDGRVEQHEGVARRPLGVHCIEVVVHDMAGYRRDSEMRPRLRIVKVIVLDVFVPAVSLSRE